MSAVPQNPRRMLAKQEEGNNAGLDQHYGLLDLYDIKEFPMWLSTSDRLLLRLSPADLKADAVVAQDGRGNYVSIIDAVKEAPAYLRNNKYIIYVKARVYHETVRISKRKTNITFVGDGKGKTVVVSSKNVKDGSTTFTSATFVNPCIARGSMGPILERFIDAVLLVTKTLFMFILLGSFTENVTCLEQ